MEVGWEAANVKHLVSGLCDIVQEEITVVTLLSYNTCRKIGSYSMAENMMCILRQDVVPSPNFPGYLSYVEATWCGTLLVEVVGYPFSRLITQECDLRWFLLATLDPLHPCQLLCGRSTKLFLVIWVPPRACKKTLQSP